MLDPTGPLAPRVYWRRRAIALGGLVLVTVLMVWAVTALVARGEPPLRLRPLPKVVGPPPEPPLCRDADIRVDAEVVRPEFRIGEPVGLRIAVTNVSPRACLRDTGGVLRELVVTTSDGQRVWSSRDCHWESTNERPVLRPGQVVRNEVRWKGWNSAPGCPLQRRAAPVGDYSVVAKLGALTSAPTPFWLRRR